MMREVGQALATGVACAPFREHLASERGENTRALSWAQVEDDFLKAMALFDTQVMAGTATEGERQNGKGDYFNDLLALVLEANSGRTLSTRRRVPGLIFPNHNLDVTYPDSGIAEVLVEAKMLGTPKHPGSERQQAAGRPAQSDLLKRAKELGFKAIDLKAGFGLEISLSGGSQPGPAGDLQSWSHAARPKTYFLMAIRVVGESDLRACIETSSNMQKILDGVGLFAYTNDHLDEPPRYYAEANFRNVRVPSAMQLGPVLYQIATILKSLPG
jgi:hypothetical protein